MTDVMEGRSSNLLAALALVNSTALENRDRFAYFREWSDEYVGVRTTGIQVGAVCFQLVLRTASTLVGKNDNPSEQRCAI